MKRIALREVAHARFGEKGRLSNISVIAYDERDYPLIREQVTVDAVRRVFGQLAAGAVTRYEVPSIGALNFVFAGLLENGRSSTLAFDESGKALSFVMLRLEIEVPDAYVPRSERTA